MYWIWWWRCREGGQGGQGSHVELRVSRRAHLPCGGRLTPREHLLSICHLTHHVVLLQMYPPASCVSGPIWRVTNRVQVGEGKEEDDEGGAREATRLLQPQLVPAVRHTITTRAFNTRIPPPGKTRLMSVRSHARGLGWLNRSTRVKYIRQLRE